MDRSGDNSTRSEMQTHTPGTLAPTSHWPRKNNASLARSRPGLLPLLFCFRYRFHAVCSCPVTGATQTVDGGTDIPKTVCDR